MTACDIIILFNCRAGALKIVLDEYRQRYQKHWTYTARIYSSSPSTCVLFLYILVYWVCALFNAKHQFYVRLLPPSRRCFTLRRRNMQCVCVWWHHLRTSSNPFKIGLNPTQKLWKRLIPMPLENVHFVEKFIGCVWSHAFKMPQDPAPSHGNEEEK